MPGLGWVTGGLLCLYEGAFSVTAVQALHAGKGMDIYLTFPWGLSFSVS